MPRLYIKNMVCNRCILAVTQEIQKLGISPVAVYLGEVEINEELTKVQAGKLEQAISALGFELLDDPSRRVIEKIKNLLVIQVQSMDIPEHFSISAYLSGALNKEYSSLSKLFSQVEGITIEQFFILQKTEKVKEQLFYKELSLSEIAWKLGYSSVQHLSAQFKKITGLSPSRLKSMSDLRRKALDQIH